jgi:hypothetical protein
MKTSPLLSNIKYLVLGLAAVGALSLVHADFPLPAASAPGANIDAPVHTGPSQVKNGGLSVNTFLANDNAQFEQQTFLNGTVFGGTPGLATSTVAIGDGTAPANIVVNGDVAAHAFIQSTSVANANSSNLCATSTGTIVTCTVGATNTPSITQVGNPVKMNNETLQTFNIWPSVQPGNVFSIIIYYHTVSVTAAAGDNAESIAQKMIVAINTTTDAQWRENPYLGTTSQPGDPNVAPASGTAGYPPTAQSTAANADHIIVTLDGAHQISVFGATAQ